MNNLMWAGRKAADYGRLERHRQALAADFSRLGAHVGIVADGADRLERGGGRAETISPHVWSHACDVAVLDDVACDGPDVSRQV